MRLGLVTLTDVTESDNCAFGLIIGLNCIISDSGCEAASHRMRLCYEAAQHQQQQQQLLDRLDYTSSILQRRHDRVIVSARKQLGGRNIIHHCLLPLLSVRFLAKS